MNRKDKTVKQLQAECRKRKVGFMMNWTKMALIKRLEDEDKRELDIKKVEDKATKEIDKAKEELESEKIKLGKSLKHLQVKSEELKKSDPEVLKKQIMEQMVRTQKNILKFLKINDLDYWEQEVREPDEYDRVKKGASMLKGILE